MSILFYNFLIFIILYILFKFYLTQCKQSMILRILWSKFTDVLSVFNCARAIGNIWSICLGVTTLGVHGQRPYGQGP